MGANHMIPEEARPAAHSAVSATLASLTDRRLRELVDGGERLGSGIGGTAALIRVEGTPVFVKRVPLTDLERRPENVRSTANLFRLPSSYQFGVGSAGWAASPRFELTEAEARFLDTTKSHDACYVMTQLVNALVHGLTTQTDPLARHAFIRRCAVSGDVPGIPAPAAAVVGRYAPVAVVMNEFYRQLHQESRATPYPANKIARACAASGFHLWH